MKTTTTIRVRKHVRKPISRQLEKTADTAQVMQLLNSFMADVKREFRKQERLTVKGRIQKKKCDSVAFIADTFSLTLDFKGGMAV